MEDFVYSAEDYIIDDEAEEIEDAMQDLIEDGYNDIDNIADIDDESDDYDFESEEEIDDEDFYDDEDDYVDYYVQQ